jgi:hypothetical protein
MPNLGRAAAIKSLKNNDFIIWHTLCTTNESKGTSPSFDMVFSVCEVKQKGGKNSSMGGR